MSIHQFSIHPLTIYQLPCGLDKADEASTAGFVNNAQPSAQRETAYSTFPVNVAIFNSPIAFVI